MRLFQAMQHAAITNPGNMVDKPLRSRIAKLMADSSSVRHFQESDTHGRGGPCVRCRCSVRRAAADALGTLDLLTRRRLGKAIPYGVYGIGRNAEWVTVASTTTRRVAADGATRLPRRFAPVAHRRLNAGYAVVSDSVVRVAGRSTIPGVTALVCIVVAGNGTSRGGRAVLIPLRLHAPAGRVEVHFNIITFTLRVIARADPSGRATNARKAERRGPAY